MKHLLILGFLSLWGISVQTANAEISYSPENPIFLDGITAKVFEIALREPAQKYEQLSTLKAVEGVMHFYAEGKHNTRIIILAEPWLSLEALTESMNLIIEGQFQIFKEEIKTLDEGYLSK